EAGMVDLEVADFDPRLLIDSVGSLLAPTASHKGLELIAYCAPDVPVRGLELARRISADDTLGGTELIMLSSEISVDRDQLDLVGVHEWLTKPVRSSELLDRLSRMLAPAATADAAPTAAPAPPAHRTARGRVLVVEDNALNQLVAEGAVSLLGYSVDIVSNGREAIEAVAHTYYSAVLMDCHMPVMDGYTATERIRLTETDGNRLPIVAMTAGARSEDRERCLAVGMDDFVTKPIEVAALAAALGTWARSERRAGAGSTGKPAEAEPAGGGGIDVTRLDALRQLGPQDGKGLLPALVDTFLESTPGIVVALRQAVVVGALREVREAAHQLKGMAANLGLIEVMVLCHQLECLASDAELADQGRVDELELALDRATLLLHEELTR
ncbi:MAG TPA: response regulator, partial [Propionibacteriaceae bacterium]